MAALTNPSVNRRRLAVLRQLSIWITGGDDLSSLTWMLNMTESIQFQVQPLPVRKQRAMAALCQYAGWEVPAEFELTPMNSQACMMHWRAVGHLLRYVSRQQQRQFWLLGGDEEIRMNQEAQPPLILPSANATQPLFGQLIGTARMPPPPVSALPAAQDLPDGGRRSFDEQPPVAAAAPEASCDARPKTVVSGGARPKTSAKPSSSGNL